MTDCRHRRREYLGIQETGVSPVLYLWNCLDCETTFAAGKPKPETPRKPRTAKRGE